jgi:hypothetical protein
MNNFTDSPLWLRFGSDLSSGDRVEYGDRHFPGVVEIESQESSLADCLRQVGLDSAKPDAWILLGAKPDAWILLSGRNIILVAD